MVQQCENCGQTVMATDQQCWHCGHTVANGRHRLVHSPQPATAVPDNTAPLASVSTILLYAGLTAVLLLLLIGTTRAIGQAPLFLFGSNTVTLAGWQPVTDHQLQFTFNLPEPWHVIDLDLAAEAPGLKSSPPLAAVTGTFDELVADTELIMLATEDTAVFSTGSPVFVLVARSQRLQQLSADEIVTYAHQQLPLDVTIIQANTLPNVDNVLKGQLHINIQQDENIWSCLEQFIPDSQSTYLVATCTSFSQFPEHLNEFEAILRSFQPLGS